MLCPLFILSLGKTQEDTAHCLPLPVRNYLVATSMLRLACDVHTGSSAIAALLLPAISYYTEFAFNKYNTIKALFTKIYKIYFYFLY